jgi:hypothetical protein
MEESKENSTSGEAENIFDKAETVATSAEEVSPATEESQTTQPEPSPTPGQADSAQPETTKDADTEHTPTENPTSTETDHDKPAEPKAVTAATLPKFDVKSLVARFSLMAPMGAKKPAVKPSVEEPIRKKEVVESLAGKFSLPYALIILCVVVRRMKTDINMYSAGVCSS